jgi:hypothetical protein
MSLFSFLGSIFKPAADLVDEVHTSEEERGRLRNKLAEIESKVSIKLMELQSQVIDANAKIAVAEQQYGNWLSKSWRPITALMLNGLVVLMAFDYIEYRELIVQITGAIDGVYMAGRSYEKGKK